MSGAPKDTSSLPRPSGRDGGSSNTPHTKPCFNTCIDYLKFRFDAGYDENFVFFAPILRILKVDLSNAQEEPGKNGYMKSRQIAIGTSLMYGGSITKTKEGLPTTLLELKGSGCRDFEDRIYSETVLSGTTLSREEILRKAWVDLITECLTKDGHCTRVDLPTDDMSGIVTSDEINAKIKKREYTTLMRHLDVTDANSVPENDVPENIMARLPGIPTVTDSKLSGYCALFGGRQTTQLCIYDKMAEQMAKGVDVFTDSWMRFEVRYYHHNAELEIVRLLEALKNGTESQHILGCLASSIEFKEPNQCANDHRSRAGTWAKWTQFLSGVEANEPFANLNPSLAVTTNAIWLVKEASKSLARICGTISKSPMEIMKLLVVDGASRFDKKDVIAINQRRRKLGLREFVSETEAAKAAFALPGMTNCNVSQEITDLFYPLEEEAE
jgi:hypothetical protein